MLASLSSKIQLGDCNKSVHATEHHHTHLAAGVGYTGTANAGGRQGAHSVGWAWQLTALLVLQDSVRIVSWREVNHQVSSVPHSISCLGVGCHRCTNTPSCMQPTAMWHHHGRTLPCKHINETVMAVCVAKSYHFVRSFTVHTPWLQFQATDSVSSCPSIDNPECSPRYGRPAVNAHWIGDTTKPWRQPGAYYPVFAQVLVD